jgi:hypothetical protein
MNRTAHWSSWITAFSGISRIIYLFQFPAKYFEEIEVVEIQAFA